MKLLTRNTSAFKFLTLGGLLSKSSFSYDLKTKVPSLIADEASYLRKVNSFGVDEENVREFIIDLLKNGLGWKNVKIEHDVLAASGKESILVECKRHDSTLLYIDEHKGGAPDETPVEELQRNLKRTGCKWGLLTDGVVYRFIYNADIAPDLFDSYIEFSLHDIVSSPHESPPELFWLIDLLSPESSLRQLNPAELAALSISNVRKIVSLIKKHSNKSLYTVIKALAVAALEDMGVRPLHTGLKSIRLAKTKKDVLAIFDSIASHDPDFHHAGHWISDDLCKDIHGLFNKLTDIDFCHVDHEFFGIVYQKLIYNGNASHYTNSKLSREMANYIASQSSKSQRPTTQPISLNDGDYILDPALGSGQLLRGLLPFHRVFFRGRSSGIDGWRKLANHFMGRDIDADAIWIAKINIWLATADKGEALVNLPEFKPLDVINASINRRGGETMREAFAINEEQNISACVSNPPWDAFKNDSRRGVSFDKKIVDKIKASLGLSVRQLNRAQIFLKIIQKIGDECPNMRFSIILPDSIFVDTNDDIRRDLNDSLDFYFSYPRNVDPENKKRIFGDVDNTRKFGIIFGRSNTVFQDTVCYPFGNITPVMITESLRVIGTHTALPLLSHPSQASIIQKWNHVRNRFPNWREGEFHQSRWADREGRVESKKGTNMIFSGSSFCDESSPWSIQPIDRSRVWKRMKSLNATDIALRDSARTLFSDYINNSKKLNSATYVPANNGVNVTNTIVYSTETRANDWLIYDSMVFGTFVEVYGTSQHMNAWRLSAVGLPPRLAATSSLAANVELCQALGVTLDEATVLYDLNTSWLQSAISKDDWIAQVGDLPPTVIEVSDQLTRAAKLKKRAAKGQRRR